MTLSFTEIALILHALESVYVADLQKEQTQLVNRLKQERERLTAKGPL